MQNGKFKELAKILKNQYDKYNTKMFFVIFYGTISQTSISDIEDFDGFINNMPIDMMHIHMCDSGDYIDVYEWELKEFEVTDVCVKIKYKNKNKQDIIYFYDMPNKLSFNSNLFAIQIDNEGNLIEHNFVTLYHYFGNYVLKNENGDYFEHYFKMEYLNKAVDIRNCGVFLFFTKKKYKKHMRERLIRIVLHNKNEIIKRETSLIEKISNNLSRSI